MNTKTKRMDILPDNSLSVKYNLANLPIYLKHEELYDFENHKTALHWNDGLQTIYVKKGSMKVVSADQTYILHESDICIIDPRYSHSFESINDENCIFYRSIIDESIFSSSELIWERYVNPLFHTSHPEINLIHPDTEHSVALRKLMQKIFRCIHEQPIAYELQLVAYFHEFLAFICKELKQDSLLAIKNSSKSNETLRLMVSYIHKNFSKTIRIDDLCEAAFISRNQCFYIFNKYTGDTPANYILKYRLNMSKTYLLNSSMPISQIATLCGFAHQSHFTNHFAKYYGITPLHFRKGQHD